jgi:hypothetical protein
MTLSFLVFFSTMSFTVEQHFCGESLVDTAIFSSAKKCGGMDAEAINYEKKACCKDTVDVVKGQDKLKITDFQDLEPSAQLTLVAYFYTYSELFESLPKRIVPHENYSPPNLTKNIQVLDETYLI